MTIIQLQCDCNNYPWGKTGKESLAARYAAAIPGRDFNIDPKKQYAEMWMGTYPTTPSKILGSGQDLQDHLNRNVEDLIGKDVAKKFGADLPFLPKVLSIAKALPLQIHPDKELAAQLHKKDPEKFGDTNHKPEIAIALGPFETFVGFLPLNDIQQLWTSTPVLNKFINEKEDFTKESLKNLVKMLLSASDEDIVEIFTSLTGMSKDKFPKQPYIPSLLPRLAEQYDKSDPGTLVALLTMNFLELNKGDAIYVPADGIHAYLSGDIIECMARSDNVLNTGFCPRADRDSVETFTSALTFSPMGKDEAILRPQTSSKGTKGFTTSLAPPLSEFEMLVTSIKGNDSEIIKALEGPGVMVVTSGSGTLKSGSQSFDVKEGLVYFVGYNSQLELTSKGGLETHLAFCKP